MNKSEKPVVLITGASSGVGRAAAVELASRGYAVALAARRQEKLRDLAKQLNDERGEGTALVCPFDLAAWDEAEELVGSVTDHFGRLDALANVAGMALLKPIARTTVDEWRQVVDLNLNASFALTRAAWSALVEAGKNDGSPIVVNVSSMASKDPFPGFGAYASAKVGVNMLTLMTGREGEKRKIRAVCIAPGAIETDMLRGMFDEKAIPADQALAPEDVAKLIADCITADRDFETGQTIFVSR